MFIKFKEIDFRFVKVKRYKFSFDFMGKKQFFFLKNDIAKRQNIKHCFLVLKQIQQSTFANFKKILFG